MLTFQWMASKRVQARVSDLKNAFGQSQKTTRSRKLATELPQAEDVDHYLYVREEHMDDRNFELAGKCYKMAMLVNKAVVFVATLKSHVGN